MKVKTHKWKSKSLSWLMLEDWGYFQVFISTRTALETEKQQNELYGLCTQAVVDLVRGLAYKAHVLYGDNHYTNLKMFMELYMDDV